LLDLRGPKGLRDWLTCRKRGNRNKQKIASLLWPGLLRPQRGPALSKAAVARKLGNRHRGKGQQKVTVQARAERFLPKTLQAPAVYFGRYGRVSGPFGGACSSRWYWSSAVDELAEVGLSTVPTMA
jgi:hypothetical protein